MRGDVNLGAMRYRIFYTMQYLLANIKILSIVVCLILKYFIEQYAYRCIVSLLASFSGYFTIISAHISMSYLKYMK